MKTKFDISGLVFCTKGSLNDIFDRVEKHYLDHGYILDKEMQEVYLLIDKEFNLEIGDRVELPYMGHLLVDWKSVNPVTNTITYAFEEE